VGPPLVRRWIGHDRGPAQFWDRRSPWAAGSMVLGRHPPPTAALSPSSVATCRDIASEWTNLAGAGPIVVNLRSAGGGPGGRCPPGAGERALLKHTASLAARVTAVGRSPPALHLLAFVVVQPPRGIGPTTPWAELLFPQLGRSTWKRARPALHDRRRGARRGASAPAPPYTATARPAEAVAGRRSPLAVRAWSGG